MLLNQMLPDTPAEEKERALRDSCEAVKPEYEYTKFLTEEELAQRREKKLLLDIRLSKMQEDLKAYVKDAKAEMEPLAIEAGALLLAVRDRVERSRETVYVFRDEESRMLGYYNSAGELIFNRRMTPEELQGSILSQVHISGPAD